MKKNTRPIYLDLTKIKMPLTATISILHRITGVILLVGVGLLLSFLYYSLKSESSFNGLQNCLNSFSASFILWGIATALVFHLCSGIRHLIMDMGIGENLEFGILSAKISLIISIIISICLGVLIW